jgi:cytosine/creatinine deaminase
MRRTTTPRSVSLLAGAGKALPGWKGVALGERPGTFDLGFGSGRIVSITPQPSQPAQWLALPAFVNFHAHADRSFAAPAPAPASLTQAVAAARAERATLTVGDIQRRAHRFLSRALAHGTALVRTHTDVDAAIGLRAIEGVLAAAAEIGDAIDVEMVAFANAAADPTRAASRDLLASAVNRGARLVGAVPALCERPLASADSLLGLAADLGVGADLHLDEHLDVGATVLEGVIDAVVRRQLDGRVTFSHCCVLSVMDDATVKRLLERMALARITLSVQPGANLYLQDRGAASPRLRGIPPVLQALRAGVDVRFGTDNVRDRFVPLGDADPLDEGRLGVLAAHLESPSELMGAMCGGRRQLAVGDGADMVLIPAESLDDALARRPTGRILVRGGRVVWPRRST